MPNNREWAIIVWIAIALVLMLSSRDLRRSVRAALKALLNYKILIALVLMTAWIGGEIFVSHRISLWNSGDVTDSAFWFASSAFVLFININDAARKEHFFKRNVLELISLSAFLGFFVNIFTFPLIVELALIPFELLLVGMSVVATSNDKYRSTKRIVNAMLSGIGIALIADVLINVVAQWNTLDKLAELRLLILPFWLTMWLLPFVYGVGICAAYGSAFFRIDWQSSVSSKARRRAKFALIVSFRARIHELDRYIRDGSNFLNIEENRTFSGVRRSAQVFRKCSQATATSTSGIATDEQDDTLLSHDNGPLTDGVTGLLGRGLQYSLRAALRTSPSDHTGNDQEAD